MRRALPKPGAWMDTLKQIFAFPIYASAAWLLWVLAQQTSSIGLGAALAGAILIALAAWAYQKSKSSAAAGRMAALATATLAVLLAIILPVRFAGVAAASSGGSTGMPHASDEWQPYDAAQVAKLNAAVRVALADPTVQDRFKKVGQEIWPVDYQTPEALAAQQKAELAKWTPVILESGIKAE